MTEDEFVTAFSLSRYPFEREELCPFRNGADLQMYALVDGFGSHAEDIRKRASSLKSRALVLIRGPKASGRSSVANYLAHHLARPATHSLHVARGRANDHHSTEPLRDALTSLYMMLDAANAFASQPSLEADFMAKVIDAKEPATTGAYKVLLNKTNSLIASLNWTIVYVIEDVKKFEQIDNAAQVFMSSPVVIFTTESDEVRDAFKSRPAPDFAVDIAALTHTDVANLLNVRWAASGGAMPAPFDQVGISKAFSANFPAGPVIDIFSQIVASAPSEGAAVPFDTATILDGALQYILKTGKK